MKCILSIISVFFLLCTPKETYNLQIFNPILIDISKIDEKDYSEIVAIVNDKYAPKTREYTDARFLKEEKMFLYFHVYSGRNSSCYRVTVDRNRSRIVNIQPDCPIEE